MHAYEVEIKVLLGTTEAKNAFFERVWSEVASLSEIYCLKVPKR
jgi:hypothetical protein